MSSTINNAFYFYPGEFKKAMFSLFFKVIIDAITEVIKSPNPSHLTYAVSSNDFKKLMI